MADTYYTSVRESAAGANKRHLSVFNAAGSGKTMVVYRIVAMGSPTATVTGMVIPLAAIRILAVPTDGSTLGPPQFAKAVTTSDDVPSQVTARTNATTPTAGNLEPIAFGLGVVSGEETSSANESVIYEAPIDGSQQVTFAEGTGFEVRQLTLASAGNVSIAAVIGLV
jgi:hypothetical protein